MMQTYRMSEEEKRYLEKYDVTKYDRPSIATDMAVFSIMGDEKKTEPGKNRSAENYRKMPEQKMKILLIQRGNYPYKDCFALPGGFCKKGEDIYETAKRELYEETNVEDAYLQPVGIFGEAGRDPRGWIVSHTFMALIDGEKYKLRAGTDAWAAHWFDLKLEKKEVQKDVKEDSALIINEFSLHLQHETIELSAVVVERKEFKQYHEQVSYEITECEGIAFDHAKLIVYAFLALQKQTEQDGKIVFDLMPETFTLTELQKVFEIILGYPLLTANFRRKMADYVIETKEIAAGAGHRPAKKFKRNVENFYR